MIARLVEKNDNFYCSYCMMQQKDIESVCWFCGYPFSNWEEVLQKQFLLMEHEKYDKTEER